MEKYNFIENKWYSFNWDYFGKDRIVIAKIERTSSGTFTISWRKYLWDNTTSTRDGYVYTAISNIKELSLCDIQQYLPEDHPEKIKVGSYLIRPDSTNPRALAVIGIAQEGFYTGPSSYFTPRPLLRFATEEEINKAENKLENSKEEFVLPEKWCLKSDEDLFVDYCNKYGVYNYSKKELSNSYAHFPAVCNCTTRPAIATGYTEITFEQFKKYVMKEEVKVEEKPKNPSLTAVHLPTQEKWNFFISKRNPTRLAERHWKYYKKESCVSLSVEGCGGKDYYLKNSYQIISFEQWCEENGYTYLEPKTETMKEDYSWWNELEPGDVIESLVNRSNLRNIGDRFTVLYIDGRCVYYKKNVNSIMPEEWKLISKAKDKKVEMEVDYSNYPKVSFKELQIGSKFVNLNWNTDIRTVTAKTVDTIFFSDSDGENQGLHKRYWDKLDCRLISHPTSEYKVVPEPEVLEMVPIDKYFKIRN